MQGAAPLQLRLAAASWLALGRHRGLGLSGLPARRPSSASCSNSSGQDASGLVEAVCRILAAARPRRARRVAQPALHARSAAVGRRGGLGDLKRRAAAALCSPDTPEAARLFADLALRKGRSALVRRSGRCKTDRLSAGLRTWWLGACGNRQDTGRTPRLEGWSLPPGAASRGLARAAPPAPGW